MLWYLLGGFKNGFKNGFRERFVNGFVNGFMGMFVDGFHGRFHERFHERFHGRFHVFKLVSMLSSCLVPNRLTEVVARDDGEASYNGEGRERPRYEHHEVL